MIAVYAEGRATYQSRLFVFREGSASRSSGSLEVRAEGRATVGSRYIEARAEGVASYAEQEWLRVFQRPGTGETGAPSTPSTLGRYPSDFKDYTVSAEDCLMPEEEFSVKFNNSDFTAKVLACNLSGGRNRPVTGSIQLLDYTSQICSKVNGYGPSNPDFRAHDMTASRVWTVNCKQANRGPRLPNLIPTDPAWTSDGITTVNVSDYSPLIEKENQSIPDVLYDEGDRVTAHEVLSDMAELAGFTPSFRFPDYMIRNFRLSGGSLTSGMDEVAGVYQAYRKWEGGRLVFERLEDRAPVGTLRDRFHIPSGGFSADTASSSVKTFFRAQRLAPMPTALSPPIPCTGGQCVGRVVEITFQSPVAFAAVRTQSRYGVVKDGVFYNGEEPVGNGFRFTGSANRKATRWVGTYHPKFTRTSSYTPFWRAQAFGGSPSQDGGGAFFVEASVATVEGVYGKREEYRDLVSDILLNEAIANVLLNSIAREVEWAIRRFRLTTPFLLPGREGDFVRCVYYGMGIDEKFLIDDWSIGWNPATGYSNSYGLRGKL